MKKTNFKETLPNCPRWISCEDFFQELDSLDTISGLIFYPTDTLYALGCAASDRKACDKIYQLKLRAKNLPLPLLASDMEMILRFGATPDRTLAQKLEEIWPAPLTVILPVCSDNDFSHLNANDTSLAFRVPDSPKCISLVRKIGEPLTCSSANVSGEPPIYDPQKIPASFLKQIDFVIDDGPKKNESPSTIIKPVKGGLKILRQGAYPKAKLEQLFDLVD